MGRSRLLVVSALALAMGGLVATGESAAALSPAELVSSSPDRGWSANGTVYAIAVSPKRVIIGGAFTRLTNNATGRSVPRRHVAALSLKTGAPLRGWRAPTNGTVRAIALARSGRVFIGGDFTKANGKARRHLVAVGPRRGHTIPRWFGGTDDEVRALAVAGKRLFIGGSFSTVNGHRHPGLTALGTPHGRLIPQWAGRVNWGKVNALSVLPSNGTLLVGGNFNKINGVSRVHLGSVHLSDGSITRWVPPTVCPKCYVIDLARGSGRVFAGTGGPGGRLVAYDVASGRILWYRRTHGNTQAVAVRHDIVFLGGHFDRVGKVARSQLASVHIGSGRLTRYHPPLDDPRYPGVFAINAGPHRLRVGGGFVGVGTIHQARYAQFRIR